jgi:hypothetical protein
MHEEERFQVYLFVADGPEDEDLCRYTVEHWFADRPAIDTLVGLLEEAKRDFATLYPDSEAVNSAVAVSRIRHQGRLNATAQSTE